MTTINTARAWGYLCRKSSYDPYTILAAYANNRKCGCANPSVRVRVIRESDYRALVKAAKGRTE